MTTKNTGPKPRDRNRVEPRSAKTTRPASAPLGQYGWECGSTGVGGFFCSFFYKNEAVAEIFSPEPLDDSDPPLDPSVTIPHDTSPSYEDYVADYTATSRTESSETVYVTVESFYESTYPGSCSCSHYRVIEEQENYTVYFRENEPTVVSTAPGQFSLVFASAEQAETARIRIPDFIRKSVDARRGQLVWEKLPTSSDFGLLQFIAELDDTIAQFSVGFLKKLFSFRDGWGSFEWGILPLVSDIAALVAAYRNRHVDTSLFPLEFQKEFKDITYDDYEIRNLIIRYTGSASTLADPYLEFLDRIGLHFDVSIVWDLIPLSFVIDYIFPIGDMLAAITNGGWVRSVNFEGWCVLSYDAIVRDPTNPDNRSLVNCFERYYVNEVLTVPYLDDNAVGGLELPSIRQLWNMLYIFFS